MKKQIRIGVFETNSSSEHSACISEIGGTILTEEEFALYESGELKVTPSGEVIQPEDYKAMIESIREQAGKEWDSGERKITPWGDGATREHYIEYWVHEYEYHNDIKRHVRYGDDEFRIQVSQREIDGKTYHVISFAQSELDY